MADVSFEDLSAWCLRWLGSPAREALFRLGYLSQVTGLRLADGREVVVKVRPALERIRGCVEVQGRLWETGFPCPRPLAGPQPISTRMATAEAFVPGGGALQSTLNRPRLFAQALARLVRLAPQPDSLPSLEPPPAWAWWDHPGNGTWPLPDDRVADLNVHPGPAWLDEAAMRVRQRLSYQQLAVVVGHMDWEAQNVFWLGQNLHVAHDWDSVALRPEAAVAGVASAVVPGIRGNGEATLDETGTFLSAYEEAQGRPWTPEERQVCWAAGLWVRCFNAKKERLDSAESPALQRLEREVPERLLLAGA